MNENKSRENEAEAWGFGINDFGVMKYAKEIIKSRGLIGINTDLYPQKTIILFRNENDAKVCRNIMEYVGCRVSKQTYKFFVPKEYAEGGENKDVD